MWYMLALDIYFKFYIDTALYNTGSHSENLFLFQFSSILIKSNEESQFGVSLI